MPDVDIDEPQLGLLILPMSEIRPNQHQPRKEFRPEELADLSASIKEKGIIQPLVVRQADSGYELIAGERRFRAAQIAGFSEVPVRIMEVLSDREMLELSLIENLQREDLNPVELAQGYRKLQSSWRLTQEQIGKRVGKDRATVANSLRLLELPPVMLDSLQRGDISVGHAKALLAVAGKPQRSALFKRIIADKLSVRQAEEISRTIGKPKPQNSARKTAEIPPQFIQYNDRLRQSLGTKVDIKKKGKRGTIQIEFYSDEDLERLVELIS